MSNKPKMQIKKNLFKNSINSRKITSRIRVQWADGTQRTIEWILKPAISIIPLKEWSKVSNEKAKIVEKPLINALKT